MRALLNVTKTRLDFNRKSMDAATIKTIVDACVPRSLPDPVALANWRNSVEDDLYTAIEAIWPLSLV